MKVINISINFIAFGIYMLESEAQRVAIPEIDQGGGDHLGLAFKECPRIAGAPAQT
jgi:hypothetical protein